MTSTLRRPLETALDAELRRIELLIARIWVVVMAFGVALATGVAIFVDPHLGVAMGILAVAGIVAFSASAWWLRRTPTHRRTSLVMAVVEGLLPCVCVAVLTYRQGAAYALASWVPPLMFAALIIAWIARLRPLAPLVVGACGAATYLAVYFLYVRAHVPTGPLHSILHDPPMQLSRATSLLVGGGIGTVIARELRRAIGRADTTVRRQEVFGKYRIVRKIGSGAGGTVHEALYCPEGGFERRVAVKQLHTHLITEPAFVEGFRAEAELGARLAHPNIVVIHDFGRHEETFFMAMELVDGLSLAKLAHRARTGHVALPSDVVGHIGRHVLRGLAHAHDGVRDDAGHPLRILHRDVCPQNILVSRIGEVKLTDFGIARVLGHMDEGASTRTIAGHEAYMAPEQIENGALDLTSDLFAMGVILWELLAGRRLFARDNPASTLLAVIATHVDPLDSPWDPFLQRALAHDPKERFPSARAMLTALDGIDAARGDDAGSKLAELVQRLGADADTSAEAPTIRESVSPKGR